MSLFFLNGIKLKQHYCFIFIKVQNAFGMHALSIKDLSKKYKSGVEALKSVSFDVQEGDFFALLGPNGAGKTTAIGIITSLVNKSSGSIEVFGHDLDKQLAKAKSCIGVVPQEVNLNLFDYNFNILINQAGFYGIPRSEGKKRAEQYPVSYTHLTLPTICSV